MRGTGRILLLLLALLLVAVGSWLIPISTDSNSVSASKERLVIITPHWDGIRTEFGRGFTVWYKEKTGTHIDIEWLDPGGTSDCVKYIKSEFKRKPSGVDVDLFFGGGTEPYLDLKKEGLLVPVSIDSAILNPIPQSVAGIDIYDIDHQWFGTVLSGFGIIYNKWVIKWLGFQEPKEWKDLANLAYKSWIGAADPRNSGSMHLMFEIILQAYGWEQGWRILSGIAANARTFSKGASDVPRMVARGDMAFGLAIDFYGWAEIAEVGEEKVGFIIPEKLTVLSADGIGMIKGAPNSKAAQAFIEFSLSEQGQKLWFVRKGTPGGPLQYELNRIPVRPDLFDKYRDQSHVRQNPFAFKSDFHFNQELASSRWTLVNDLAGVALIDNEQILKNAWKQGTEQYALWNSMPLTENEGIVLAASWREPIERNKIMLQWQNFFELKYSRLAGDNDEQHSN